MLYIVTNAIVLGLLWLLEAGAVTCDSLFPRFRRFTNQQMRLLVLSCTMRFLLGHYLGFVLYDLSEL